MVSRKGGRHGLAKYPSRQRLRQSRRLGIMNGSKPYGPSGQQRLATPRPERRIDSACFALPSPRFSPGGSPLPSDGRGVRGEGNGREGRGRNVRRAAKNRTRWMVRDGSGCCSLSHRERVRVRGNHTNSDPAYRTTPGTVELRGSSGRAGGFPGS